MVENKDITSNSLDDTLLKYLLNQLAVPVVVGQACYNDLGTIEDIKVVYVNEQHVKQTKGFLKVGDSYVTMKKSLPEGIDWFNSCINTLKTGIPFEYDYFTSRINVWFHLVMQKLTTELCVFTIYNITSEKIKESHLEFLETNDTNTGLANSKKFNDVLQTSIQATEKKHTQLGLILLDIDNLQSINDLSGRATGDEIINTCANILLRMENDDIQAFRIEGDEFALIIRNLDSDAKLRSITEDLFVSLSTRNVSVSMGIARYPEQDTTSATLFRN